MNNMKKWLSAVLMAGLLLTGCNNTSPTDDAVTVGQSDATTTTIPESVVPEYVWTTAESVDSDESAGEGSTFSVSPYKLSASLRKMMSDDAQKDYTNLITAIMLGNSSVRIVQDSAVLCVQALYDSFPGAWLLESVTFTPDEPQIDEAESAEETKETEEVPSDAEPVWGTLTLQYREEKEAYLKKMEDFFVRTGEMIQASGVLSAQTQDEAALLLYRYVVMNITDWTGSELSSYGAIMKLDAQKDIADGKKYAPGGTQAAVLTYLWTQIGIDSALMTGNLNGTARTWCAFSLNGKWYHCDPNLEMMDTGGNGLFFYGMTDDYRQKEGMSGMKACGTLPETYHDDAEPVVCTIRADSERYKVFRQCFHSVLMENHEGVSAYYIGVFEPEIYRFS